MKVVYGSVNYLMIIFSLIILFVMRAYVKMKTKETNKELMTKSRKMKEKDEYKQIKRKKEKK